MDHRAIELYSPLNNKISLKVIPGHFATSYSHVNLYLDMTCMKTRHDEALEVGKALAHQYMNHVLVDTIVCMDGCEVIAAFLAQELSNPGKLAMNAYKTINIISPEFNTSNQIIIRENNHSALDGKNVLLLVASATTGTTIRKSLECIEFYGGKIQGISAIFSAVDDIDEVHVNAIFHTNDLPQYCNYIIDECPFCKDNIKLEAIINGYGYIKL